MVTDAYGIISMIATFIACILALPVVVVVFELQFAKVRNDLDEEISPERCAYLREQARREGRYTELE